MQYMYMYVYIALNCTFIGCSLATDLHTELCMSTYYPIHMYMGHDEVRGHHIRKVHIGASNKSVAALALVGCCLATIISKAHILKLKW